MFPSLWHHFYFMNDSQYPFKVFVLRVTTSGTSWPAWLNSNDTVMWSRPSTPSYNLSYFGFCNAYNLFAQLTNKRFSLVSLVFIVKLDSNVKCSTCRHSVLLSLSDKVDLLSGREYCHGDFSAVQLASNPHEFYISDIIKLYKMPNRSFHFHNLEKPYIVNHFAMFWF